MRRAAGLGGDGHVAGAQHIGADALAGVVLHQRDMLQRRSVEDDVRLHLREDTLDAGGVADVAERLTTREERVPLGDLALDVEQVVFGGVDHGQMGAAAGGDLTAELGTDAAPRACHQHPSTGHQRANRLWIQSDRRPAQEFLDADLAQLGGVGRRAHLDHAVAAQQAHAFRLQAAQTLGAEGAHRAVGEEQDRGRRQAAVAQTGQHAVEIGDRAQNADAAQFIAGLAVERRDHADRGVTFAKPGRRAQEGFGLGGRADDQQARQRRMHRGGAKAQHRIEQHSLMQAPPDHPQRRQQRRLDQGRAGHGAQATVDAWMGQAGNDQERRRRQDGRAEKSQVVGGRDEAPRGPLHPESQLHDECCEAVQGRLKQRVPRERHVDDEIATGQQGHEGQQNVGRDLSCMPHETNL